MDIGLVILAQTAAAGPPQALVLMEALQVAEPTKEAAKRPGQPFFEQDRMAAGEAQIQLADAALDAFRDRFNLDDHAPFSLYDWMDLPAPGVTPGRHRDYVFCSLYLKLGKGTSAACFRDSDRDGKLDAVARFEGGVPKGGLSFERLSPVGYRYVDHSGDKLPYSMYRRPSLGLRYTVDKATGHLRFTAMADSREVGEVIDVDAASLPVTINVSGAVVRVAAWEGKRATLAVTQPFPQLPVRIETPTYQWEKYPGPGFISFASEPMPGTPPAGQ